MDWTRLEMINLPEKHELTLFHKAPEIEYSETLRPIIPPAPITHIKGGNENDLRKMVGILFDLPHDHIQWSVDPNPFNMKHEDKPKMKHCHKCHNDYKVKLLLTPDILQKLPEEVFEKEICPTCLLTMIGDLFQPHGVIREIEVVVEEIDVVVESDIIGTHGLKVRYVTKEKG